jgi:energy-coupling factor transporter ATP-binding protein EcfA2
VSLRVGAGTITGLLGRNGAGKTTLLRLLAGREFASSGEVRVLGAWPSVGGLFTGLIALGLTDVIAVLAAVLLAQRPHHDPPASRDSPSPSSVTSAEPVSPAPPASPGWASRRGTLGSSPVSHHEVSHGLKGWDLRPYRQTHMQVKLNRRWESRCGGVDRSD